MTATAVAPTPETSKPEVLLIDLSALFWSAWHATANSGASNAVNDVVKAVMDCHQGDFSRKVAICVDSGRSFRKDLSPEYKANRPEKDARSLDALAKTKQRLKDDGFLLWSVDGYEADDVIASACEIAVKRGYPVMIASHDKDLLQLVWEGGVRALRTHLKDVIFEEKDVVSKYGVAPEQLGDWLALVGDSSDNIKGAPNVGEKTATDLLKNFGTIANLYEALDANDAERLRVVKPSVQKSLRENRAQVELARKLVALRTDLPINFDEIFERRERKEPAVEQDAGDLDDGHPAAAAPAPTPGIQASAAPAGPTPANDAKKVIEVKANEISVLPAPANLIVKGQWEMELEPRTPAAAMAAARHIFASGLYQKFPNPESIWAAIMRGRELGLPTMTALDVIHVIDGTPAMAAHYLIARVQASPRVEYWEFVEGDSKKAVYEGKLKKSKRKLVHTYTIEDAVAAGLTSMEPIPRTAPFGIDQQTKKPFKDARGSWDKFRPQMLRKQCAVQGGRILDPAAILGLSSLEELGVEVG